MLVNNTLTEFEHKSDKVFNKIDADQSETIDADEIKNYLNECGVNKSEIDPLIIKFMALDKDKNNKLDKLEFKSIYKELIVNAKSE